MALIQTCRFARVKMFLSATLDITYKAPCTRARKKTARPRARFWILRAASSPCQGVCHWEITGLEMRVMLLLSIENSEPVKNVDTAVPRRIVPTTPLIIKKVS